MLRNTVCWKICEILVRGLGGKSSHLSPKLLSRIPDMKLGLPKEGSAVDPESLYVSLVNRNP